MILTAHQPVYIPWLGLFHKIALADLFCFFDDVQYEPKGWNNRNKIKFLGGATNWLTVPVLKSGHREKSYLDIEINNALPWRRKHWKSIELNYSGAPFFALYKENLRHFYTQEWSRLADFNYQMLLFLLEALGVSTQVIRMSDYSFRGTKSALVLDMCVQLGADTYIFGSEGRNYAEVQDFYKEGVIPVFQSYSHPNYPQFHGEFQSHLSVIDLLFNCGSDSLEILMSGNVDHQTLLSEFAPEKL